LPAQRVDDTCLTDLARVGEAQDIAKGVLFL
jgi:hypothetical protein